MEMPELKMNQSIPAISVTDCDNQFGANVTTTNSTPRNVKSADDKKPKPDGNIATEKAIADTSDNGKNTKLPKMATKTRNHPPASEMVQASIKSLKMRNGASAEAICKYIGDNYQVDAGKLKPLVDRYFNDAVKKGILVKTGGTGEKSRFKLQKTDEAAKKARNAKDLLKKDGVERKIKSTENANKIAREPKTVLKKDKNDTKGKIGDVKKLSRKLKDAKKSDKTEKRPVGRPRKQ